MDTAPAVQPLTSAEEDELRRLMALAGDGKLVPDTFARCIALNDRKHAAAAR